MDCDGQIINYLNLLRLQRGEYRCENVVNTSNDQLQEPQPCELPTQPPRSYDLMTMANDLRCQINDYVDKLNWMSVDVMDQCSFVQLLFTLYFVYGMILRRVYAQFASMPTAISIVVRCAWFLTGRLLDITNTPNHQDACLKTAVLCLQLAFFAAAACLFVMVYAPVILLGWKLFLSIVDIPLLVSSFFY